MSSSSGGHVRGKGGAQGSKNPPGSRRPGPESTATKRQKLAKDKANKEAWRRFTSEPGGGSGGVSAQAGGSSGGNNGEEEKEPAADEAGGVPETYFLMRCRRLAHLLLLEHNYRWNLRQSVSNRGLTEVVGGFYDQSMLEAIQRMTSKLYGNEKYSE